MVDLVVEIGVVEVELGDLHVDLEGLELPEGLGLGLLGHPGRPLDVTDRLALDLVGYAARLDKGEGERDIERVWGGRGKDMSFDVFFLSCTVCRAGHFRYFLIFSITKNDFLHFLSS